jgi:cholesterol transport system auxiliary component
MFVTRGTILGRLALFAGAAWIAGFCTSCLSGPAPVDHYYRIEVAAPAAPAPPVLAGTLEVDRPRVEAIAQGRRMLYRDAGKPGEIAQHSYHHWADPPSLMVQAQLVDYLRAAGVAEHVVTPAVHVDSDYRLTGRVVHLERILGSGTARVVVELELALLKNAGNEILLFETYRDEREAAGNGVGESVTAYGEALGSIFGHFVADLPRP